MAEPDEQRRRILIAIDESEHSKRSFDYFLQEVSDKNHEVILVHMFTPPTPPTMSTKDPNNEHWIKWRGKVEHKVNELKKLLTSYEVLCDENKVLNRAILHSGDPGEGICELAKENNVDLIIIGCRGLNKLRRTFLGSVSDYVIRESGKAVLVVPPK